MALNANQYALIVQRIQKILAQNWRFFLKKCKGGTKKNFSNITKKQPSFERPKRTLAQMALSFKQYAFKLQGLENILVQTAAPKVPENQPSLERPKNTLAQNAFYSNLYAPLVQTIGEDFDAENVSKSARMAQLWQCLQSHPKPAFCEKVQRGRPREIFQKSSKNQPCLKSPKKL